jgi:hypothetical protein
MNTSFGAQEVHEDSTKDSTNLTQKPTKYFSDEIQPWTKEYCSNEQINMDETKLLRINIIPFPYCI